MIKVCLLLILLVLAPALLGTLLCDGGETASGAPGWTGPVKEYLTGIMVQWCSFQLLAVPMILLQKPLHVLLVTWVCLLLILGAVGLVLTVRRRIRTEAGKSGNSREKPADIRKCAMPAVLYAAALLVIGWQCSQYAFRMHIDDDDSRFIVSAVSAYEHDTMLLENPANGDPLPRPEGELVKDVASPWSIYIAALSGIAHLHPAILAHTILSVWLLLCSYLVFWLAAAALFPGTKADSAEKRAWFLLFSAAAVTFFGGNVYIKGAFMLSRIWQGKAVLAAFMLPWLLYLTYVSDFRDSMWNDGCFRHSARRMTLLAVSVTAACLLSGVGVLMSGTVAGTYGLWKTVRTRRLWALAMYGAACMPALLYGSIYVLVK